MPPVPIRSVLVRDPDGKFNAQALLCTNQAIAPLQILEWFVRRWQLEVTFQEVRAHLGVETQRQWSDKAIARTTKRLVGVVLVGNCAGSPFTSSTEVSSTTGGLVLQTLADIC